MSKLNAASKNTAIDTKIRQVIDELLSQPSGNLSNLTQDDIEVFASSVELSHEEQLFCIGEQFKRVLAEKVGPARHHGSYGTGELTNAPTLDGMIPTRNLNSIKCELDELGYMASVAIDALGDARDADSEWQRARLDFIANDIFQRCVKVSRSLEAVMGRPDSEAKTAE